MYVPRYWFRAVAGNRCCLGWSDKNVAEAERLARERLAKVQALVAGAGSSAGWDYYPATPVKEEILETQTAGDCAILITRNRAGAQVLNTDRVAFVDIDLPEPPTAFRIFLKQLFGRPVPPRDPAAAALARVRSWAEGAGALLRAYRTARGLRLIRMDKLMDPAGDETDRMFSALGTDPQYQRLCRVQKSFRARLTPKPRRVGMAAGCPGSHPRTDPEVQQQFAQWLARYERASSPRATCSFVAAYGSARPTEAARLVSELHDRRTTRPGAELA